MKNKISLLAWALFIGSFFLVQETALAVTNLEEELKKLEAQSSAKITTSIRMDQTNHFGSLLSGKVDFQTFLDTEGGFKMAQNVLYDIKGEDSEMGPGSNIVMDMDYIFIDDDVFFKLNDIEIEGENDGDIVDAANLTSIVGQWILLDEGQEIYPLIHSSINIFFSLDIVDALARSTDFDKDTLEEMEESFFRQRVLTLKSNQKFHKGYPAYDFRLNRRAVFLFFQEIGGLLMQLSSSPFTIGELFEYRKPVARAKNLAGLIYMDEDSDMIKGYTLHFATQFGLPRIDTDFFEMSIYVDTSFDEFNGVYDISKPATYIGVEDVDSLLLEDFIVEPEEEEEESIEVKDKLPQEDVVEMIDDDFTIGVEDAPITIVEFVDYGSYKTKKMFLEEFPTIKEKYIDTNLVRWVYRDFPPTGIGSSLEAAIAAECAGQQDKFEEMHEKLLITQPAHSDDFIEKYAQELVPNTNTFRDCIQSPEARQEVLDDKAYGESLGVTNIPTYFINGTKVVGVHTAEEFGEKIESKMLDVLIIPGRPEGSIDNYKDIEGDDARLGDKDAPVTIVEFGDYECPFCIKFFENVFPLIKENYIDTGKVKYIYRDFPLSFHTQAKRAASAAECAGEQRHYYAMHDKILGGKFALTEKFLRVYAREIGLNEEDFAECLADKRYYPEIEEDIADGEALGVSGVPTFFINGVRISGAKPYEEFEKLIEVEYLRATQGE